MSIAFPTPQFSEHPVEHELLAAIHANKADDSPRLIYADWLEEHDQPEKAENIRLAVLQYRQGPSDAIRDELEHAIHRIYGTETFKRRGFVYTIFCDAVQWLDHHERYRTLCPALERVWLKDPLEFSYWDDRRPTRLVIHGTGIATKTISWSLEQEPLMVEYLRTTTDPLAEKRQFLLNLIWPGIEIKLMSQPPSPSQLPSLPVSSLRDRLEYFQPQYQPRSDLPILYTTTE